MHTTAQPFAHPRHRPARGRRGSGVRAYDLRGHKKQMVDPDMGTWLYTYDALGQLVNQTDAKGNITLMAYDVLGRMTSRSEADLNSNWYFDTYKGGAACPMGIGKLCQETSSTGYNRVLSYDSLGRQSSTSTTLDTTYVDSFSYDNTYGRVLRRTYPGGVVVQYGYTPLGYLQSVTRVSSGVVLWQANTLDAEGHLLQQTYGNNVATTQTFDPTNGRISTITAGAGNAVQNTYYRYDSIGNVQTRNDQTQNLLESFGYDILNRINISTVNASATSYSDNYYYDNTGNLTSRSDLGTYSYNTVTIPSTNNTCPANSILSGSGCVFTQSAAAAPSYTCTTGTPSGQNCVGTITVPATVSQYTCPAGYNLSGTSCVKVATTSAANACPNAATFSAWVWNGTSFTITPTLVCAAPSCPSGTTSNGTYCLVSSLTSTSCPSGSSVVEQLMGFLSYEYACTVPPTTCTSGTAMGDTCVTTTNVPATANYNASSCSSGNLSGTNCIVPYTTPATASYSPCPSGQTLAGNACVTTQASITNPTVNGRPHALGFVTLPGNVGNRSYSYDANGNRTSEIWEQGTSVTSTRSYNYSSFNMPASISATTNGTTVGETYVYGPEHQRVKQVSTTLGTIYYLNPGNSGDLFYEKELKPNGDTELRSYVTAGGAVIAEIKQINGQPEQTRYFQRDNLGSTNVITDESGNVVERLAYEPFGKRRFVAGQEDPANAVTDSLGQRGFTNHEHMDELGLINMNGRVYDPMTGRFMSADPMIQAPYNSQSYNRYTYVWNSPLNYTDPTGYDFGGWFGEQVGGATHTIGNAIGVGVHDIGSDPNLRMMATIAIAAETGYYVSLAEGEVAGAAAGGFAGGFVGSRGNLKDGVIGALEGMAFDQVGTWTNGHNPTPNYFNTPDFYENVAGHALVGCAGGAAMGTGCGSGAASAGVSAFFTPLMSSNRYYGTAQASIIGGTTSVLAGGKFANGAETAAFGYLYNASVIAQSGGSAIAGAGGEGSFGVYMTVPYYKDADFDIGAFWSGGVGGGYNVGGSTQYGYVDGDVNNIRGVSYNVNIGGTAVGGTVMYDANGNRVGYSAGPSAEIGLSGTYVKTGAFSLREKGRALGSWIYDKLHP